MSDTYTVGLTKQVNDINMQEIYHEMNDIFKENPHSLPEERIAQSYSFKAGRLLIGPNGKVIDVDFESCTQLGCNFVDKLKLLEAGELFWADLFSSQASDEITALDFNQILNDQSHDEFDNVKLVSESGMQLFVKLSIWAINHGSEPFAVVLISDAKRKSYFDNMHKLVLSDSVSDYASSLIWSFKDAFKQMDSAQNRGLELLLFEMANIDVLTNLPNRKMFLRILQQAIDDSIKTGLLYGMGVGLIKINHMSKVNEEHGITHGDALINQIGLEIKSVLRSSDFISRFSGTTFGFALPGAHKEENLPIIADRIINHLTSVGLLGKDQLIKLSIGMTLYNSTGDSVDKLLNQANTALVKASKLKTNNYKIC